MEMTSTGLLISRTPKDTSQRKRSTKSCRSETVALSEILAWVKYGEALRLCWESLSVNCATKTKIFKNIEKEMIFVAGKVKNYSFQMERVH